MSLKLVSLASGSKGNCTLVFSDTTAVLVDAGICKSRINSSLYELGLSINDLQGILVTHEHIDHVKYIKDFDCKIYAHPQTMRVLIEKRYDIRNKASIDNYELGFTIGDIKITPFRISHDAVYPLGYTFECGGKKVSVATDMGIPTNSVLTNIKESEAILFESNHDVQMLKNGPYPKMLKDRILSNLGHLSNDTSAECVVKIAQYGNLKHVILGHMSETNNLPFIAKDNMENVLKNANLDYIKVYLSYPDRTSEVISI